MPEANTAVPAPAPENSDNPTLEVLPDPQKRRAPSPLNRGQQADLSLALEICTIARRPEYAPGLEAEGIAEAFVNELVNDITAVGATSQSAVASTQASQDATRAEAQAAQNLVSSLRAMQAKARQVHLPEHPDLLGNYHVGQDLAESRPILAGVSQNIIQQTDQERPPGVNTEIIARVTNERTAYLEAGATQRAEVAKGKQARALRDAMIKSITARRKKVQYAADAKWPAGKTEHVQARKDFQLPAKRPYSY